MNKFFLIVNNEKDPEGEVSGGIKRVFEEEGLECVIGRSRSQRRMGVFTYTDSSSIPEDTECIITLGGDGTMIQAFRDTRKRALPIIGINMGKLGFLAEIELKAVREAAIALRDGDFHIEERMLLEGDIIRGGEMIDSSIALNDIVTTRVGSLRVVNFQINVNSLPLINIKADGIIISTPTGSTGYNLSAGGPIVEPLARLIVITPICAHALKTRSIILSESDNIEIVPVMTHDTQVHSVETSFDGRHLIPHNKGDVIRVRCSGETMKMLKLSHDSFMEVLHRKMEE